MEIKNTATEYLHTQQLGLRHETKAKGNATAARWLRNSLTAAATPTAVCTSLTVIATVLKASYRNHNGAVISPMSLIRSLVISGVTIWSLGAVLNHFLADDDVDAQKTDWGKLRPSLFMSSTYHARFLPTKYRFEFPLLYVGFPAKMKGTLGGKLFAVKPAETEVVVEKSKWTVFSVDPSRYLNPTLPFEEKLGDAMRRDVGLCNSSPQC